MKKKEYVAPQLEVMEMEMQGCLLAGSRQQDTDATETGTLDNFDSDWQ